MHLFFTSFGLRNLGVLLVVLLRCAGNAGAQTLPNDTTGLKKPLYVRATDPEGTGSRLIRSLKREKRRMQKLENLLKRRAAATNAPLPGLEANARQRNEQMLQVLSTQIDSLQSISNRLPGTATYRRVLPGKEMAESQRVNVPKPDSAALLSIGKGLLERTKYGQGFEALESQPKELLPAKIEGVGQQVDQGVKALQDKEQLQHYARAKAAKLATAQFATRIPQLQEAQQKFTRYKRKMAWLKEGSGENANSLTDAPLVRRFVYGGNLQIATLEPLSLVAAPFAGFRLNRKFLAGFRFSIVTTIGRTTHPAKSFGGEIGYSGFVDYKLPTTWFARGELERMRKAVPNPNGDGYTVTWRNNAYVGVGRYIGTIKNYKLTVVLQCNLLHKHLCRLDAEAFGFRFGITK